MLRTNLSTRPFYNERAVHAVLAVIALALVALTAWQLARIVSLSREKTELNASIGRDGGEAADLTGKAAAIRGGLNQSELQLVAAEAKEANQLIAQRTFSWTELFNQLEATLPAEVMLVSVQPAFKDGRIDISMEIQGRRTEDIVDFFDRLEKTGDFRNVTWQQENVTEEGLHRMMMSAVYAPRAGGRS